MGRVRKPVVVIVLAIAAHKQSNWMDRIEGTRTRLRLYEPSQSFLFFSYLITFLPLFCFLSLKLNKHFIIVKKTLF
jgi:hypothetical protein